MENSKVHQVSSNIDNYSVQQLPSSIMSRNVIRNFSDVLIKLRNYYMHID